MLASEVRAAYEALTGGQQHAGSGSVPQGSFQAGTPAPALLQERLSELTSTRHRLPVHLLSQTAGAAVAPPPEVPPVPAEPAIQAPSPLQNTPERPSSAAELSTPTKVPPTQAAAVPREDTRRGPEENSESQFEVGDDANPQNKEEASPQSPGSRNDDSTASPTANQEQLGAREGSGVLTVTPVKRPVQDSSPPAVQTPTLGFLKLYRLLTEAHRQNLQPHLVLQLVVTPPLDDSCLSKPGQLTPACSSAVSSTAGGSVVDPPCQENGIALDHHEPEESHYESLCPSMEVLENTATQSPQRLKYLLSCIHSRKQNPLRPPPPRQLLGGTRWLLQAVCACALLVAWKLKKM
ncbi:hypothetical protein FQA47_013760 [Oryzias melastigma]|uniref:Uncharacterized protein n=1 Tax=Oryzias melastigma TaxID=30732 RepID=A0A834C751_ORYME|nr:hypothetical protein FQA47_013760 [Oryzias melastigma]